MRVWYSLRLTDCRGNAVRKRFVYVDCMTSVHRIFSEYRRRIHVRFAERNGQGRTMSGRRQSRRRRNICRASGEVEAAPTFADAPKSQQMKAKMRKDMMKNKE